MPAPESNIVLCAECNTPMKVVWNEDDSIREIFKVCKCDTPAEEYVKRESDK